MLRDAFAKLAQGAKGDGLVYEQPKLVLPLQRDHGFEVADLTCVHVDALDDQKSSRDLG